MGIIIYGVKKATIGVDEFIVSCPSCESDRLADVLISSNYYHMFFIPMFPIEKEASTVCKTCGLKSYDVPFNKRTFKNYAELKSKFRHPWYTYFFPGSIGLIILISVVFALVQSD